MTRRIQILLVVVMLIGVFSAAWQLSNKAAVEPLQRQVTFIVDAYEVESFGADAERLWQGLIAHGVRAAFIRDVSELEKLPDGLQPIAVVNEENWPAWQISGFQPDGVVFSFNTFPAPLSQVRQVFPTQPFGLLEFTRTSVFAEHASELVGNTWRVYDRQARTTNRFQNEFAISILERQAELTVIRLLTEATVDVNIQRAQAIQEAVVAGGHAIGQLPTPRPPFTQPDWVVWGMVLGLGAAAALGLFSLLGAVLPPWVPLALVPLAPIAFLVAQLVINPLLLRQLLSLAAAIVYPAVGFLAWWRQAVKDRAERQAGIWPVFGGFSRMIAFAFVGGLSVHAFLARSIFQLNLKQFLGVKFGYLLPLGLAAALIGLFVLQDVKRHPKQYLNRRRTQQVIALAVLVFLGAVFVLLNRSGNATVIPVPAWEMTFRDKLFKLFWARPRTKEFLGYPALLVGLLLWQKREYLYGGLAILLGYIGVLSMVNTFEHLHHPILLEIMRSGLGLVIGLIISLPLLWLTNRYSYLLKGRHKS